MALLKHIILVFILFISWFCYAAPAQEGTAAGANAAEYAVGSSLLTGTAVATALTGVLLLSMSGGNDGSNTSTNTSTTTTTSTASSN